MTARGEEIAEEALEAAARAMLAALPGRDPEDIRAAAASVRAALRRYEAATAFSRSRSPSIRDGQRKLGVCGGCGKEIQLVLDAYGDWRPVSHGIRRAS